MANIHTSSLEPLQVPKQKVTWILLPLAHITTVLPILSLNFITLDSHVSVIVEYLLFCVGMGSPSMPLCFVYVVHRPEVHSLLSRAQTHVSATFSLLISIDI